jgi:hypothetical protein
MKTSERNAQPPTNPQVRRKRPRVVAKQRHMYRVELYSTAHMSQCQLVEAESKAKAIKIAKTDIDENVWEYEGIVDNARIFIVSCSEEH